MQALDATSHHAVKAEDRGMTQRVGAAGPVFQLTGFRRAWSS